MTVTPTAPSGALGAITKFAVSEESFVTTTLFTVTPLPTTATVVAPATKFVPASVTATVAPTAPLVGVTAVAVGSGGITVNGRATLVPWAVVTVTAFCRAARGGAIARTAVRAVVVRDGDRLNGDTGAAHGDSGRVRDEMVPEGVTRMVAP